MQKHLTPQILEPTTLSLQQYQCVKLQRWRPYKILLKIYAYFLKDFNKYLREREHVRT